jgi:hypothetical protein
VDRPLHLSTTKTLHCTRLTSSRCPDSPRQVPSGPAARAEIRGPVDHDGSAYPESTGPGLRGSWNRRRSGTTPSSTERPLISVAVHLSCRQLLRLLVPSRRHLHLHVSPANTPCRSGEAGQAGHLPQAEAEPPAPSNLHVPFPAIHIAINIGVALLERYSKTALARRSRLLCVVFHSQCPANPLLLFRCRVPTDGLALLMPLLRRRHQPLATIIQHRDPMRGASS